MAPDRKMRVMMSFKRRPNRGGNPYLDQLTQVLSSSIQVFDFSWSRAARGSFDVLHVHWPEQIVRSRYPLVAAVKSILLFSFVRVLWLRKAVVQTVHNSTPHEVGTPIERWSLRALHESVDWFILLNNTSHAPDAQRSGVILHGDYAAWFGPVTAELEERDSIPGRLLFFGAVRPYKNLEGLIEAFAHLVPEKSDLSLLIAGQAVDPSYQESVQHLAAAAGIETHFGFLSDRDLAQEIARSELVVLPYSEFENSGAALLSLTLGRPILVPAGPASEELAAEFGSEWVIRYDALEPSTLTQAVSHRSQPQGFPDMSRRDWGEGARAHLAAYERATAIRRKKRGSRV